MPDHIITSSGHHIIIALLRGEREQGDFAGALDGVRQDALVRGARARGTARQDLAAFRDELPQPGRVLVIDVLDFFHAEVTDFPADTLVLVRLFRGSWRHSLSF